MADINAGLDPITTYTIPGMIHPPRIPAPRTEAGFCWVLKSSSRSPRRFTGVGIGEFGPPLEEKQIEILGGETSNICYFHPYLGKMNPF